MNWQRILCVALAGVCYACSSFLEGAAHDGLLAVAGVFLGLMSPQVGKSKSAGVAAAVSMAFLLSATFMGGCGQFKNVVTKVNEGAKAVCERFAADRPDEFRALAAKVEAASPDELAGLNQDDRDSFNPRALCVIPTVVDYVLNFLGEHPDAMSGPDGAAECATPEPGPVALD